MVSLGLQVTHRVHTLPIPGPWFKKAHCTWNRGPQAGGFQTHQPAEGLLLPRPPNVPLLRALWSLLVGVWGSLKGSGGGAGGASEFLPCAFNHNSGILL